jgi:DNA-binding CsgD family transcriptional regulator
LEAQNPEALVRSLEADTQIQGQETRPPGDNTNKPAFDSIGAKNLLGEKAGESGAGSERQPITEEIKTLVVRLHREGHSPVEIARLADLTRTEVDLILAVRARDVEEIVETVREEQEGDSSAIHRGVGELAAEGCGPTEIARRLGISTSEVNLALAVIKNWNKGKKQ